MQNLDKEFKTLFYKIENSFPNNDFFFNRIGNDSKAKVVLVDNQTIVEVELKNIEQNINEAILTIKQLTQQLDS